MKYKALLEGLEVTEVQFSRLEGEKRIDAETYDKQYIHYKSKIMSMKYTTLLNECDVVRKGIFNINATNYSTEGIPFVRISNLKNMTIDSQDIVYIPTDLHLLNIKTALKRNDVILSKTAIPAASLVDLPECNTSQDTVAVKLKEGSAINSHYLVVFLNTKYGITQMKKRFSGNVQMHLNLDECKTNLFIPILNYACQQEIELSFENAIDKRRRAIQLYSEAEAYLLECLGMTDFAANPDAYNVKTLKESFLETGRFDAEYYLPKYEDYYRLVQSYSNGYELLGDACDIKDANYIPETGMRYKYIELANIGKSGEITGCDIQDGENLPTRARRLVHQGDVIVSSIEGSLESCALVTDGYDGALCSTGFYVLQSHKLNPETLLTLFKSLPMQQLMKKGCSGTILSAISKPELEKLPVPIIRQEAQDEIAQHIQRSFALRKEAMELLEKAKISVEQAVDNWGGEIIFNELQKQSVREERCAIWLLLAEIGVLPIIEQENKIVNTYKTLSDSFLSSGRLDAEYYQPKYDYLFSRIGRFRTSTLGELAEIRKSIEPGSDAYQETGVPFIRVSDLSKFGLSGTTIHLNAEDYQDVPRPQKDTILLSKDGSVGIAYKVEEPLDVITSGAILHLALKSRDVLPDYLTLVLNSTIVRLQAERDAGGSIIQHWKPSEIENVVIPILPMYVQERIVEQLKYSFKLRKESQSLLEEAKLMVEMSIEGSGYSADFP